MRRFERLLLFAVALAVGGSLGHWLLSGSGTLNWIVFMMTCLVLGEIFHQIDKWICEHQKN